MRRRTAVGQRESGSASGPDTSSLIDVAFLLLVYFLVTSTLDPKEGDLMLAMGGIPPTSVIVPDRALISVDTEGRVAMEDEILDSDASRRDLPRLEDRLRTYVEANRILAAGRPPSVELKVDDGVPGQRFIDVINCLAGVGIHDISIHGLEEPTSL